MRFRYRLGYYMVGFSIGLFFVAMVFLGKDTSCNYFPNARVLKNIRTKPFTYSSEASKILAEPWIDTVDIKNTLTYGDVDFDRSNKNFQNGKIYVIEGKTMKDVPITLEVVNYPNKAILHNISR